MVGRIRGMADVRVDFAGLHLDNPVILASGGPGWDGEHLKKCGLAGAGAVIPKSLGPPSKWLHHPRVGRMGLIVLGKQPFGMINLELFSTIPLDRWLRKELKIAAEGGVPIIASIVADPSPSKTLKIAEKIVDTGCVSMIEINVSCPMPAEKVGMHICKDPALVAEQTKTVKEAVAVPISVKLPPNFPNMVEIAKKVEEAGADAISATNSVQAFYGVDIETGRPLLPAFGGYSGPAIKPITLRCVAQIAQAVKVPISGIGGVSSWRDVVEYIMVGATTVQTCTAVMWRGLQVFKEFSDGLRSFMDRKGYKTIEDFRGIALKHLTTVEKLAMMEPKYAVVDRTLCNSCNICVRVCPYNAIKMVKNKASVQSEKCDGCGLCRAWCPATAIELE
jgi:dihydropyrimidine dehydrogenase (NAD+) subunit PreA